MNKEPNYFTDLYNLISNPSLQPIGLRETRPFNEWLIHVLMTSSCMHEIKRLIRLYPEVLED